MSTIRCIYSEPPKFPATDQHPDAVRYVVGGRIVDAIGGQPTQAEVDAVLTPPTDAAGVKEQRARTLDALAASDPQVAKTVEVLKAAGLI